MEENSARQNFEIKKKMILNYKEGVTKNRPKIKFKKINISSMNLQNSTERKNTDKRTPNDQHAKTASMNLGPQRSESMWPQPLKNAGTLCL